MDYIALTTYLVVMITTPGPNNIMLTTSGANFGYRRTLPHMFGIIFGNSCQLLLVCLGLGVIFTQYPIIHEILKWVGLAYMAYLAWKMLGLHAAKTKQLGEPLTFKQAALFQLVNAKAWVIIITVPSLFFPKEGEVLLPTIIVVLMSGFITLFATNMWTLFGSFMRQFLKTERNQFLFNGFMAGLLVITAIMLVFE